MAGEKILVFAGEDTFSHKAIQCLADAGYSIVAASPFRLSALRFSSHVSKVERVGWDLLDHPGPVLVDRVNAIVAKHEPDVILPVDESVIRALGQVPGQVDGTITAMPSAEAFETCDDKAQFAAFCDASGVPQPDSWTVIDGPADLADVTMEFPLIVKPCRGGGGTGVALVDSMAELQEHMDSGAPGTTPPLLLQELVPGIDIDCSFYSEGGQIIASAVQTRKSMTAKDLRFVDRPDVVAVCDTLAAALGYDGLAHVDLRVDERDDSIRAIELNPRVWGSVTYSLWGGINFPALAVTQALGQENTWPSVMAPSLVINPAVTPSMVARSWTRRGAPDGLPDEELAAWDTNSADPLPTIAAEGRAVARRIRHKINNLVGR